MNIPRFISWEIKGVFRKSPKVNEDFNKLDSYYHLGKAHFLCTSFAKRKSKEISGRHLSGELQCNL